MNNNYVFIFLALLTGALIPIQATTNARFSKAVGSPLMAGLMVFIVGLVCVSLYNILMKAPFPSIQKLRSAPAYSYLGGVIVAIYVVMITVLVPRLGVGSAIGLIVAGQIFCSVAIDHFGLLGAKMQPLDVKRFSGMILMIVGLYLIIKEKT